MPETFTPEELNLLRQWYDALADVMPSYLEQPDHELGLKLGGTSSETKKLKAKTNA